MSVKELLATSLGRKDEIPNTELAQAIAARKDKKAVEELVTLLSGKDKDLQNDSIKVLYEAGALEPALIAPYLDVFITLLQSKNNRLQWGAMTAINAITAAGPAHVYAALPAILVAADKGSVITKDQCMQVLISLYRLKAYTANVFPLILEQLGQSLPNQLPMYAEQNLAIVLPKDKQALSAVLRSRLDDMEKESKRKRLEKVIGKLDKA